MPSKQPEFKLLERGFKDILVMIPGWAADYRIFSAIKLDYNYLFPFNFSPRNFIPGLLSFLNKSKKRKVSLFGCSLGGFLACEFAAQYPQLVDTLILAGVRNNYEASLLEEVSAELKKNKRAFLYKFYLNCFSKEDRQGATWFRHNLLEDYLKKFKLRELFEGLEYLKAAQIEPCVLSAIKKISIIHGKQDNIAPFKEAREIKSNLPQARFIVFPSAGHIPFFHPEFKERFPHG